MNRAMSSRLHRINRLIKIIKRVKSFAFHRKWSKTGYAKQRQRQRHSRAEQIEVKEEKKNDERSETEALNAMHTQYNIKSFLPVNLIVYDFHRRRRCRFFFVQSTM